MNVYKMLERLVLR